MTASALKTAALAAVGLLAAALAGCAAPAEPAPAAPPPAYPTRIAVASLPIKAARPARPGPEAVAPFLLHRYWVDDLLLMERDDWPLSSREYLVEYLQATVAPGTWGPPANIKFMSKEIAITQNPNAHRGIDRELSFLRNITRLSPEEMLPARLPPDPEEEMLRRAYQVSDLAVHPAPGPPGFPFAAGGLANLVEAVQANIQPGTWGPPAHIEHMFDCLVVTHTVEAHREVKAFLAELRAAGVKIGPVRVQP